MAISRDLLRQTVRLNLDAVNLAPGYWVTPDDLLVVGIRNSLAGVTVQVEARLWLPDGSFSEASFQVAPPNDRALRFSGQTLDYGFLVAATADAVGGTLPNRGQTYVTLSLGRPPLATFRDLLSLGSDYISASLGLEAPNGRTVGSIEGPGNLRSVLGTAPAAGADWTQTVPTAARWRIRAIQASLTSSATVANRDPRIQFTDGANVLETLEVADAQAASLTDAYSWVLGWPATTALAATTTRPLGGDPILFPGWVVRSNTTNLQVGDQWTAPRFLIEEWLED